MRFTPVISPFSFLTKMLYIVAVNCPLTVASITQVRQMTTQKKAKNPRESGKPWIQNRFFSLQTWMPETTEADDCCPFFFFDVTSCILVTQIQDFLVKDKIQKNKTKKQNIRVKKLHARLHFQDFTWSTLFTAFTWPLLTFSRPESFIKQTSHYMVTWQDKMSYFSYACVF